ncbi:MAG: hypothetical protein DYG89_34550 [Caldilinea sp. CFX5]|nr:hypothetical protein [Caldilinea sp. CFX5]
MVAKVDPHRLEQSPKTNGAHQAEKLVLTKPSADSDPFYYGWRTEWTIGPDGEPVFKTIPLPHYDEDDHPFELTGYRLVEGAYVPMQPDEAGRFYSATANVWFGLTEDERALVVEDGATGQPLLDNRSEYEARRRAEEQTESAIQRAEAEARRAEAEAQARTAAEQRAAAAEAELARLRALWQTDQGKNP